MTSPPVDDHAYLFAPVRLHDFLDYITTESVDPSAPDPRALADEWRAASAHFRQLQQAESGWADRVPVGSIPRSLESLMRQVAADPIFRRSFSAVPGEIGMVELDRLVVSQKTINLTHVARLTEELGPAPAAELIARVCLPVDHPAPPPRVRRVDGNSFVFASDSNDLRFLETALVPPDPAFVASGRVAGVVGAVVGYGSNYLNAIGLEGRLVLNNGFHRAYALRSLGMTHVPCVVERLGGREDLERTGRAALRREPDVYFGLARPPVLKDFFDPRLCRIVRRLRLTRQVRVTVTVEELDVP